MTLGHRFADHSECMKQHLFLVLASIGGRKMALWPDLHQRVSWCLLKLPLVRKRHGVMGWGCVGLFSQPNFHHCQQFRCASSKATITARLTVHNSLLGGGDKRDRGTLASASSHPSQPAACGSALMAQGLGEELMYTGEEALEAGTMSMSM